MKKVVVIAVALLLVTSYVPLFAAEGGQKGAGDGEAYTMNALYYGDKIEVGTTENQVKSAWGEPDLIKDNVWMYNFTSLRVDSMPMGLRVKKYYLVFGDGVLMNVEKENYYLPRSELVSFDIDGRDFPEIIEIDRDMFQPDDIIRYMPKTSSGIEAEIARPGHGYGDTQYPHTGPPGGGPPGGGPPGGGPPGGGPPGGGPPGGPPGKNK